MLAWLVMPQREVEVERNGTTGSGDVTGRERLAFVIGMCLRDARLAAGLDQGDVAAALGVRRQALSRVENGRRLPSMEFVERYAQALGAPITLTFGAFGLADREVRRERVQAAIVPRIPVERFREDSMQARMLAVVMDDKWLSDPTAAYLRFVAEAVADLGLYLRNAPRFRKAVGFGAAHYEAIDWARARAALNGPAMRSVHLRIVRELPEVIAEADRRRLARAG